MGCCIIPRHEALIPRPWDPRGKGMVKRSTSLPGHRAFSGVASLCFFQGWKEKISQFPGFIVVENLDLSILFWEQKTLHIKKPLEI